MEEICNQGEGKLKYSTWRKKQFVKCFKYLNHPPNVTFVIDWKLYS